jgi:hypothetical protein
MGKEVGFPLALPGGDLMAHMSARHRTRLVDALFEACGGFERAQTWIERNDANYEVFFKIWAKGQARQMTTEHTLGQSAESLVDRLDEIDRRREAKIIDVVPTEIVR